MKNLFGMNLEELEIALQPEKKFRSKQIAEWMYRKNVHDFESMKNLPKEFRSKLARDFSIDRARMISKLESKDQLTTKFLLRFSDGVAIETVAMKHDYGNSVCISSQAGCSMGCRFCASTIKGLERNLTAGEMLDQVLFAKKFFEGKLDSIVVMGSGEPLLNFENLVKFLKILHDLVGMSYRSVTVSTSGIIPRIHDLMEENLPLTLSISLHAPLDNLRSDLMPINKKFPLRDLVEVGKLYGEKTGRRVTYEYILIENLNDSPEIAGILAKLLKNQLASVNLIPINPVNERGFKRPSKDRIESFARILNSRGVTATIRKEMGADINAACGQLRNKFLER